MASSDILSHTQAMSNWHEHTKASKKDTEFTVLTFLRETHPDYHVIRTDASSCDLLGYAAAGFAKAVPDNDDTSDTSRIYKEPSARLLKKPGILRDSMKFGRYTYTWNDKTYLVYKCQYFERSVGVKKLLFVLSPKGAAWIGGKVERNHPNTDALLLSAGKWSTELHNEIYVFDNAYWSKDKELYKSVQDSSWDDVILNKQMKDNLIDDVQGFFDNQALYKKLSVPWKRGVIMHGVPGNGKTISIKALINSLSKREEPVPSLYVKNFDACQGPKYSIRTIFSHARIMAPCLLIFEDLDSLVTDKTRSYFLNEVDGLESNDGILMIGSTNHLEKLDPAISKRPSRFDRKYHFRVPEYEERVLYARFWMRKLKGSELVEFPEGLCAVVAGLTEGFSFAYLKELFVIALLTIARGVVEDADDTPTSSGSSAVVVEHEETAEKSDAKPAPRKGRGIPNIDVPEELKSNLLYRAIRAQTKMLFEEMDSTGENVGEGKKKATTSAEGESDYQMQLEMLMIRSAGMRQAEAEADNGDGCAC
ncbi:P-loop containing nucleoside triphosphate hydrolase protein [Halenospora varia]|nr:P-loop containing nucleoside triphosphate hydrolase protein [Halenospora varia]